ncbi:MAG: hypothetical protein IJV65_06775 [Kiritimatiellae bacterium]|nr:hypothetical protein [Kiritimatiellia bacterium]
MRFPVLRVLPAACVFLAGASAASADMFEPLFTATRVVGAVQVVRPGREAEPMRLDHAYPYGTRVIVPGVPAVTNASTVYGEAIVELAGDFKFRLGPGADVTLLDMSVGEGEDLSEIKVLDVAAGTVNTFITANTQKTGTGGAGDAQVDKNLAAIVIRTPLAECTHMSQRNEVRVAPDPYAPGKLVCTFSTQNGMMEINGPQFTVKNMNRNTAVQVAGDKDETAISTVNGEYTVTFEKGQDAEERARFKSRCIGKIRRQYADVGGRMAVAVMIYYPKGNTYEMKSYNYLEGQTNVGMWTSVAAAVSGEHSAMTVAQELGGGEAAGSSGESDSWSGEDDGGWDGSGEDDGGWDGSGGDEGGDDFGSDDFDFGW